MGDKVGLSIPSISTNIPSLDYAVIGTGGIPRGRIIEVIGPESAGKTTICLHIIACEQRLGGLATFIDAEHALDPTYAASLGVNVGDLLVSQPDYGEQALSTVEALIESNQVTLIVIDSVAALVPKAELDGDMGDSFMGLHARLMSQGLRKITGLAAKNNITVIFINQIREKIGVMFGSPETTTGGRALKHWASLRLDVRRISGGIKSGDVLIGHQLKVKAIKNKVGIPHQETIVDLIYNQGIDTFSDLIDYSVSLGVIEKAGSWYKFQDIKTQQKAELQNAVKQITEECEKARKSETSTEETNPHKQKAE